MFLKRSEGVENVLLSSCGANVLPRPVSLRDHLGNHVLHLHGIRRAGGVCFCGLAKLKPQSEVKLLVETRRLLRQFVEHPRCFCFSHRLTLGRAKSVIFSEKKQSFVGPPISPLSDPTESTARIRA